MRNRGYYSEFGGAYVPEILVATFDELVDHFDEARVDPAFWQSYLDLMASYSGRETPLTPAENLTEHFGGGSVIGFRITLDRELCRHAAHGVGAATVAGLDQQAAIGTHQWLGHADITAIRQHHIAAVTEFLDDAEDVIPAPTIEANDVLAQLVENFVHLEGSCNRLNQHSHLDAAGWHAKGLLGVQEHFVPKARLKMVFQLRQIEIGAGAARQ